MSKKTTDKNTDKTAVKTCEPVFTKEQLVMSEYFKHRRYALKACLDDDKKYTVKEAEKLLDKLTKGGEK